MKGRIIAAGCLAALSAGHLAAQVSGISARAFPRQVSAAQLPAATGSEGMRIVTDALSSSSCEIGGGTVKLVCFDNGAWTVVGLGVKGPEGPPGPIGPTGATGPQGPTGVDGAAGAAGPQGPAGAAATLAVGSVTTGASGSSATVTNAGTSSAAVFDFSIPRGDTGAQGPTGATGAAGSNGATGPAGPVAGASTQVVFNDAGAAAGDAGLTYNKTTDALTVAGQIRAPDGTLASPGVAFANETGSGIYRIASGNWGIAVSGILIWDIAGSRIATNKRIDVNKDGVGNGASIRSDASATVPSLLPDWNDPDTGIGRAGTDRLALIAGGVEGAEVSAAALIASKKLVTAGQPLTISDNANGATRATATLTPTAAYTPVTCSDPQGCDVTLSETGAVDGQLLRIVCLTANACGFADTAGVTELAGAVDLGQYDCLTLLYATDRFVEIGRSNN